MTQTWGSKCLKLGLASCLAIGAALVYFEDCIFAQVTSDSTLGAERSVVTPKVVINGVPSDRIDGGAIRGANLFHSFHEFNVDEGRGVYFTNPTGIQNILSRVTGNNTSQILGKLGLLGGNANIFLINPNGIIFGSKASLDVGGSFVATTANVIQFGNQGFFSASAPNVPSVLTVNPSTLLFNQIAAGSIINNSREPGGQRLDPFEPSEVRNLFGLQVPDGRSLLLVGGNVSLDGGGLNTLGGRVELGGVAGAGTVDLDVNDNNLRLSFPDGVALADVSLTRGARVDASGEGGGSILVQGRRVTLNDRFRIEADTLGSKPGGNLTVSASDSVALTGASTDGILSTRTFGAGDAGDITIITGNLTVHNGAQVLTFTSGEGSGGQLTVTASESVDLIGTSPNNENSGLFSIAGAAGKAGNITIRTGRLLVGDGAAISTESAGVGLAPSFIPAEGAGGNLTVIASDSVQVFGTSLSGLTGGLFTGTSGTAAAGSLRIETGRLIIRYGAEVSSATLEEGQGGNLEVTAYDSIELTGSSSTLTTQTTGSGAAGELQLKTGQLLVQAGAEVTVKSEGTGDAGNLQVQARSIRLDSGGKLTATTESGKGGGNIRLQDLDLLLLRRNSEISTNAGGTGRGGNITIDTDILVGLEDSDITANAFEGEGGFIQITAQGIFGLEVREKLTGNSDITAFSQKDPSLNGVVKINRPEADPSAELVVLPTELVDVSGLIAQGCSADGGNMARGSSEFFATGRGGLPPNPSEALRSETALADLGTSVQSEANRTSAATANNQISSSPVPLVEAQGWVIGSKGEVLLTAQAPTVKPHIPWLTPTTCHGS
jgi:filamentous hemagglutinin family protein